MSFKFGVRSRRNLEGIHPDLMQVMMRAINNSSIDFVVLEGLRTPARQMQLLKQGATTVSRSRHLTGHAVDIAPVVGGVVRWDWPLYHKLAAEIKKAALFENIPIEWGGDWKTFKDGPHFQLPWKQYP